MRTDGSILSFVSGEILFQVGGGGGGGAGVVSFSICFWWFVSV